jgi:hypothetical protein
MIYSFYDDTGKITYSIECSPQSIDVSTDKFVEGRPDGRVCYVRDGKVVNRPRSPIFYDEHNKTLRGIPPNAKIVINGKKYDATDDTCELDFTYPGNYHVMVWSFPYLNYEATITK